MEKIEKLETSTVSKINEIEANFAEIEKLFGVDKKGERMKDIEKILQNSASVSTDELAKIMMEKTEIERDLREIDKIRSIINDAKFYLQMWREGENEALYEAQKLAQDAERMIREKKIEILLSGEHDKKNGILTINAGAGGTESMDWAAMLLRMYVRWAGKKGFKVEVADKLEGEEAGIKSATVLIEGKFAYGLLKGESGVHRLVRISPFDANRRRHTSFSAVYVYPEIDDISINIDPKDLKIETFRASGPGGQYVNMTDTAVRITHLPSGIVVSCQSERSQYRNKLTAMKILASKLYDIELQRRKKELESISGEKKEISWGNQIRSYILYPYKLVKDHRTGFEVHNADNILDGELDDFMESFLKLSIFK